MLDFLLPIWQPFVDAMVWAIMWTHDAIDRAGLPGASGLAIIAFTLVLRLLTMPLYVQQLRSTKAMQKLQPEIQALQKKYGKDREKLMQEQMKLYREYKINPAAGCAPMLVQMPIWIGLYSALQHLNSTPQFQDSFLWLPSLAQHDPFYILPILTVATQWVVTKMMATPSADPQQAQMNQVMQFMPLMFGFFALNVPAGLVLYWVVSNLFTMAQQYFMMGPGGLRPQSATASGVAASRAVEPATSAPVSTKAADETAPPAPANRRGRADAGESETAEPVAGLSSKDITASTVRGGIRTYTLRADGREDESEDTAGSRRARGRKRQR